MSGWIPPFALGGEGHEDAERVFGAELLAFREAVAAVLARGGQADGLVAGELDGDLAPGQAIASVDFNPKKFKRETIAALKPRSMVLIARGVEERLSEVLRLG